MKGRVKRMLIILFDIKEIVKKELVLADKRVNSVYCCDNLWRMRESERRLRLELRRQKNWLFHYDNAPSHISFFTREL
jgi:hypothetical protein